MSLQNKSDISNRNTWIDMMRVVFCLYIIFMHGEIYLRDITVNRLFEGGYLGVDFFFMVTGFYLFQYTNDSFSVLKKKVKKLYPQYVASILLLFLIFVLKEELTIEKTRRLVWNLIMLQMPLGADINGVAWFVAALIPCSFVVYLLFVNVRGGGKPRPKNANVNNSGCCLLYNIFVYIYDKQFC